MRRSMMRPALSMHHNPYDPAVAQAFHGWLTQTGLLAVLTGAQPAAAAPAPAAAVPVVGQSYFATPLNKMVLTAYTLVKSEETGTAYLKGSSPHSQWSPVTATGWGYDIANLPPGGYKVIGFGPKYGSMPPSEIYAEVVAGSASPAPLPTPAAPTTPKPGDLIPPSDLFDPAAWLALPIGSILAFGGKGYANKVPALAYRTYSGFNTLYFTTGNTALPVDKGANQMATAVKDYDTKWVAWVSYGHAGADTPETRKAAFLAVAPNLPGFDGWKHHLTEAGLLAPAATAPPAPAAGAKPTLPGGMKYLAASTDFSELEDATSSSNGALIWLQQPDGAHTIWYHAAPSEWGPIEDSGSYSQEEDNKNNYAFKAAAQAASYIVLLGYAYPDSTSRGALIHKLLAVFPGAASGAAAPSVAVSPEALAALKELHAYIKGDGDKVGMTGAIMLRINKNHDDYFSSAFGSDFDGYGTPIGRAKFLSKLTDFGIMQSYGKLKSGQKAVQATPLGVEVAKAWVAGYSDPALLGSALPPKMKLLPPDYDFAGLPTTAEGTKAGALVVLYSFAPGWTAWQHFGGGEWLKLTANGHYTGIAKDEAEFASMAKEAVAVLYAAKTAWSPEKSAALLAAVPATAPVAAPTAKAKPVAKAPGAVAEATLAAAAVPVASEADKAKAKSIPSIAANLAALAPLVKEAAAKVTGVVTEAGPAGLTMDLTGTASSVRVDNATEKTVTLGYYKNSVLLSEKTIPIPVPDAAGTVASTIAQAMVYFLVYSDKSEAKESASPPPAPGEPMVVDGVPLVTGANLTTQAQIDALPNGSILAPLDKIGASPVYGIGNAPLPATLRYLAMPDWDTYAKPLSADPTVLAQQGIVFPAPKAPGWPAVQVAPTLATYSDLPVGTLLRTDFLPGGTGTGSSLFAVRVDTTGYQKIDTGGVVNTTSSKRSPSKLVADAAANKATPYIVFLGKGKVETPSFYKEYIEGKRADLADTAATTAAAQVEILAAALGIDPRVAALFSTKALQAMLAQTGIPYMGGTFFPSTPVAHAYPAVLLKKNPAILGGFRSNPERYRDVVRQVLRNPRPSLRDLQDAELLDAAGLPLHDAVPRRRNPDSGYAEATDTETGIIKAVVDALKKALGSGEKPSSGTMVGSAIDSRLESMYKSGGNVRKETGDGLGAYLRYLVAARAAGLWKNYIDPGARAVTRALGYGAAQADDPSQSIRINADGLSQIEVMKAAGFITGPVTPTQAMIAWLNRQKSGNGWFRADVGEPWQPSNNLTPPSNYAGKEPDNGGPDYIGKNSSSGSIQHWNTYQRAEGGGKWNGKLPYPEWAGEPWANVEGFSVDYHDVTWQKYTAGEWGASLFGYQGGGGGVKAYPGNFLMRANTRDPRFVLLPGSKLGAGPMTSFESEAAIVFVSIDEKPLKIEVISVGKSIAPGVHLTREQMTAWIRARPSYPTGPKPIGPAAGVTLHRNPAPKSRSVDLATVHAILFDRARWGPGAVRHWLAAHGLAGFAVRAAGDVWRVEVYAPDAFRPGSIKRRDVGDGMFAMVGKPL